MPGVARRYEEKSGNAMIYEEIRGDTRRSSLCPRRYEEMPGEMEKLKRRNTKKYKEMKGNTNRYVGYKKVCHGFFNRYKFDAIRRDTKKM